MGPLKFFRRHYSKRKLFEAIQVYGVYGSESRFSPDFRTIVINCHNLKTIWWRLLHMTGYWQACDATTICNDASNK